MYAKSTLNDDRRYYRKLCDDREKSERKNDEVSFEKAINLI
jgi:hypothetical protein